MFGSFKTSRQHGEAIRPPETSVSAQPRRLMCEDRTWEWVQCGISAEDANTKKLQNVSYLIPVMFSVVLTPEILPRYYESPKLTKESTTSPIAWQNQNAFYYIKHIRGKLHEKFLQEKRWDFPLPITSPHFFRTEIYFGENTVSRQNSAHSRL